ncbi:multicopper oxidase [Colletotrichum navitas]|uniref:Multicopper oxidase n=1 Tax=Colletotrichum navitas TaxID=681940 RepID=A0AAD8PXJ7_9PEZI|nr:multicopper oxidase [Colletotrichum navitas]KAK1589940.1 multicopper oxidase [Colletotrichum navitas]
MDLERGSTHEIPSNPVPTRLTVLDQHADDDDDDASIGVFADDRSEKSPFLRLSHDEERGRRNTPRKTRFSAAVFGAVVFFVIFYASGMIFPATPTHSPAAAAPVHVVQEPIPSTPRLRDTSEYVLGPSWDFSAARSVREYHWTIQDATLNPDGILRPMMLINNQFPGPLVECNQGDTIVVHVRNEAANATAIHFHGMLQNGTNSMDGTVGVTQCPIAPNATFTYRFTVDNQSGTYWYHAHHSVQASDGIVGPLVIHSAAETSPENTYATDRIVMIQDHYHNTSAELLMDYLQPDRENEEPVPSSGLINGRNHRDCSDFDGWDCQNDAPRLQSLESFDLAPNERHRLRIINTGAFAEFQVEIDEHPFYVTEVDGTAVHPEPFHRLNVLPAQRYSVVLETNATAADSFWMRARMVTHCFARENPRLDPEVRAVVRYSSPARPSGVSTAARDAAGAYAEPQSKSWGEAPEVECRDMDAAVLRPVEVVPAPKATASMFLRANFEIGAWRLSRGFFNASTWHANVTSPALYRAVEASKAENGTLLPPLTTGVNDVAFDPEREFVYQTTGIQTVDIVISNFDDGAHPFHLHGHKLFVLKQGPTGYPPASAAELEEELAAAGVLGNPLRRDTVTVQGYGWAAVRVVLDNPGMWAFHCHNAWHAEAGMMMVIAAMVETSKEWGVGEEETRLCGLPGVEKGVRPGDDVWFGNFG